VKLTAISCILAALGAVAAGRPGPDQREITRINVLAVHAFSQGRGEKVYDRELEQYKDALDGLDYDTYHHLSSKMLQAKMGEEAVYEINSRYKLCVEPLSRESSGQTRLNVRVEMTPKEAQGRAGWERKPVNVIKTTLLISPDKKLKLRGLKLDRGELVVVLMLRD